MSAPEFSDETLPHKIIGLHETLTAHNVPYAFGGAIALACHAEPRSTDDIDVNIFTSSDRGPEVVAALEKLFAVEDRVERLHQIATRDQTRMLWGPTYVEHWLRHFVGDDPILDQFRSIKSRDGL